MKVTALGVLILLLLAPSAISQVPQDKLIVPGQRIGKWTLAMTIADLAKMNGTSSAVTPGSGQDRAHDTMVHVWEPLRFFAVTNTRRLQRVEVLSTFSIQFKTEKGISVSSKRADVEAAYGRPTAETRQSDAVARLIYDEIGLGIRLYVSTGVVANVDVFRPGTAKQLWKF